MANITKEQFYKEICNFREQMGLKTFWADLNKVYLAKKAIGICYLSLSKESYQDEAVITSFKAVMLEFINRASFMGVDLTRL